MRIETKLLYLQNPVVFLWDYDLLADLTGWPGGPVEYVSAFLSPLFAFDWLGALVVTLLATLICATTRHLLRGIAAVDNHLTSLIPAVLILMMLGQYGHPVELCVGLLAVLVLASAYVWIGTSPDAVRLAAFLIASSFAYYVAAGLYFVFACLCGIFELRVKRYIPLGLLCVLCGVLVPMAAGVWLFDLNVTQAYQGLMPAYQEHWLAIPSSVPAAWMMWIGLLVFLPVAAVSLLWRRGRARLPVSSRKPQSRRKVPAEDARGPHAPSSSLRSLVESAALVALVFAADVVLFDSPKKCLLQMVYSAEQQEWDDVLTQVRRLPPSDSRLLDIRTQFHVNRALYFKGDLLDRMFSYPQSLNGRTLALVAQDATFMAQTTPRQCSDILFELGRINESEHMAYEALEIYGDRPRILKRLIYINVLQGRPEAARRFIALLERSLLHSKWAHRRRRQLDNDPGLASVSAVASRRELMVVRDSVDDIKSLESMLQGLLERNPRNRMAFEYQMAHYLLTQQLDKLIANLHRFDDFDGNRLPRHCQEALVVHWTAIGSQESDIGERMISSKT